MSSPVSASGCCAAELLLWVSDAACSFKHSSLVLQLESLLTSKDCCCRLMAIERKVSSPPKGWRGGLLQTRLGGICGEALSPHPSAEVSS